MGRERVDSFTEAKELSGEHELVRHGKTGPDIHAGELRVHGASGQGMDGVAADYDELSRLNTRLLELRDTLAKQHAEAAELTEPLADGTSPVTGPMRKAFYQRADVQEGVQGVLRQYLEEVDAAIGAINSTLNTYRGVDGFTGSRFDRLANDEGAR
jgi:hypothetical protein